MREQVEALEHHAQFGTLFGHFLVVQGLQHAFAALVDVFVADHLAVDVDLAAGQGLQLLIRRRNVDLPEPDGPRITVTVPGMTVMSMPLSTCRLPKAL